MLDFPLFLQTAFHFSTFLNVFLPLLSELELRDELESLKLNTGGLRTEGFGADLDFSLEWPFRTAMKNRNHEILTAQLRVRIDCFRIGYWQDLLGSGKYQTVLALSAQ